jgi:hypothetical protein
MKITDRRFALGCGIGYAVYRVKKATGSSGEHQRKKRVSKRVSQAPIACITLYFLGL